jgi:uncharacterized protein (DUF1501 family)
MSNADPNTSTRRQFFGQASCAAVGSVPVLNTLLNLRLAGGLAAETGGAEGGYRALVCLFLSGGNDSFNMLAPFGGPEHAEYAASRADLALGQAGLAEVHPDNTPGRTFGVHAGMPGLAALFDAGHAAFVANVGTLIEPVADRAQVAQNLRRLPLGLYSHSDQIEQWQTSVPHSRSGLGWAGRMADLINDLNTGQAVSMNISTDGSNVWQTGRTVAEFAAYPGNAQEPEGGAIPLVGYNPNFSTNNVFEQVTSGAVDSQLALEYAHLLQGTYQEKRRSALASYEAFSAAVAGELPGGVVFPNTALGRQLKVVARALMGRETLGACRQTFFVNWGGWDHHSETLAHQAAMLPQVDAAVSAFWQQLVALGVEDNIVLFSASDFGRTLTSNGRGSDHAWGGNQIVVGGAVKGKNIYGEYPSLAVNPESGPEANPLDTGRGRLIPTTSCDEFFAEMALWLGVPRSSLPLVLPNIGNFVSTSGSGAPVGFLL